MVFSGFSKVFSGFFNGFLLVYLGKLAGQDLSLEPYQKDSVLTKKEDFFFLISHGADHTLTLLAAEIWRSIRQGDFSPCRRVFVWSQRPQIGRMGFVSLSDFVLSQCVFFEFFFGLSMSQVIIRFSKAFLGWHIQGYDLWLFLAGLSLQQAPSSTYQVLSKYYPHTDHQKDIASRGPHTSPLQDSFGRPQNKCCTVQSWTFLWYSTKVRRKRTHPETTCCNYIPGHQRNVFWLVLCNKKPPKKHGTFGGSR